MVGVIFTYAIGSKMLFRLYLIAGAILPALSGAQVVSDPGVAGGPLEVVHLYNDQWPTGMLSVVIYIDYE